MSIRGARICLLTQNALASNPRLVKEADSLHRAGAEVHVVANSVAAFVRPLDETILEAAPWARNVHLYDEDDAPRRIALKVRERAARLASRVLDPGRSALLAIERSNRCVHHIRRALRAVPPCDLYIAHYLSALPPAAEAAERHEAALAFDAEDLHHGEVPLVSSDAKAEVRGRQRIQRTYLPRCDYLSGASPLICAAYERDYGVRMTTILNVFPREALPAGDPVPTGAPIRFYWFSQTIGPGRGLEAAITALRRSGLDASLALRGFVGDAYRSQLEQLAGGLPVEFLAPTPPETMIREAARFDAGLCLEQRQPPHRDACLTNKLFVYLQAGLPVALTPTQAHLDFASRLGAAALLLPEADGDWAQALSDWASDGLRAARAEARRLGQEVFAWENEEKILLGLVEGALLRRRPDRSRIDALAAPARNCP